MGRSSTAASILARVETAHRTALIRCDDYSGSMSSRPANPAVAVALAGLMTALVGVLDYATGVELSVFPLYFVPVALIAWRFGRGASFAAAALSMASWETSNQLIGVRYSTPFVEVWNLSVQFGALIGFALVVATLRKQIMRETELARFDALTGIANRREFHDRLEQELRRARRTKKPLVIACIDLDDFKLVNDRAGHAAGDALLIRVAKTAQSICRESDLAARLGGDEFALLLPECEAQDAAHVLERLQASLREPAESGAESVSMSIGAVCFAEPPTSSDEAMRTADALMYRVKRGGKNDLRIENNGLPQLDAGSIAKSA